MKKVKKEIVTVTKSVDEIVKQIRKLIRIESKEVRKLVETFEDGPILDQLQFMYSLMSTRVKKERYIVEPNVILRAPWIIMEYFYGDKGLSKYDELIIIGSMFRCLKIESWIRLVKLAGASHHTYAYYTIPAGQQELEDDNYFSFCPELKDFDTEPEGCTDPIMIRMT